MANKILITSYDLYDSRYFIDPDSALLMESCETLAEAQERIEKYGLVAVVKTISEFISKNKLKVISSELIDLD